MVEPIKQASSLFTEYGLNVVFSRFTHKDLASANPVQKFFSG